jgi:pimeloyl-ACP methyl ester carboxylesterase
MPDRVRSLLLASSLAPLDDERHYAGMVTTNWLLFQCAKYAPGLVCVPVGILGVVASWNAAWRLDGLAESLSEQDREMLESGALRELMLADTAESLRQGYGAAEREVTLLSRDWGFSLADVHVPVAILHGEKDAITPAPMGRTLAERLPRSRLIMRREAGHFLLFRHWRAAVRMVLAPR